MPFEVTDPGQGNRLDLHRSFNKRGVLTVEFTGDNASVRIAGALIKCRGLRIRVGSDSVVDIGARCALSNTSIVVGDCGRVVIGACSTFMARTCFVATEPSSILIGQDCMIAADVHFRTTDSHTLFDQATRQRLNHAADIVIEDHVWIGMQSIIMKGVRIGAHSVVGLRSVVTRDVAPHTAVGGTPAREIRRGIDWDRASWPIDYDEWATAHPPKS